MDSNKDQIGKALKEIVPMKGLLFSEKSLFSEVMCKPQIMGLKSLSLVKLEKREEEMIKEQQQEE